jgi:predicted ATPase/class 3 adenylate cyclase
VAVDHLPTGTVTFLFTDIEGSTRLVQALGDRWVDVLERHDQLVAGAITRHHGTVVKNEGDSFFAAFETASEAVRAAVDAQRAIAEEPWPGDGMVKVRIGVHTGLGILGGSDYVGLDVHRAARISNAAHGGQVVLSETTAVLVERDPIEGAGLRDLGKHRLKDLSEPETIFQVSIPGLSEDFPQLRTLDAIPNNLPAQVTSFVGREEELARALELLETARVLTLTGPGGTGKTRLALQVAAEVSDQFEDGVYFVDLSPVTEVEVVPSAILHAIGLAASAKGQSPEERLLEQLRGMNLLAVLDNFEHLLPAAPLVAALAAAVPRSKVIVTSRAPLRIRGEQEMPVPPLVTGGTEDMVAALESDAVRLLIDRATAVRPDFKVTPSNARAVVELVDRLDGLPLAIELVASRLRLFPVETIVERLDSGMLGSGSVDLPQRQQTIHNTIAWSYDILDPELQTLFDRLSVFAGGARLEEIEAIFRDWDPGVDLIDGLSRLVDHSLLLGGESMGSPWFRMLHVIREFAAGRLEERGEANAAGLAHLRVFTALASTAQPHLLTKERLHWFDVLEANHDNLRAAIEWGVEHEETDLTLEVAAKVWRFWQARGHLHEAKRRLEAVLALEGGDIRLRAAAIEALGGIQWWRGEMESCLAHYQQALEIQRELGRSADLARAIYNHTLAAVYKYGDSEEYDRMFFEARAIYEELGDRNGLGDVAWGLGNSRLLTDRLDGGFSLFLEAAEHYRAGGNEFGVGWALFEAGDISRRAGDPMKAWPYLVEALQLFAGHRDVSGLVMIFAEMGAIAFALGDRLRSYRLAGVVGALRKSSGTEIVALDFNFVEGLDDDSLAVLTGVDAEALEEGHHLPVDEAVAYGLAGPTDH